MNTLIKYEFLKIAKKRSTLTVMFVSLIITAFLFGLPILQFQTYDRDVLMKGMDGIRYERSIKDGIDVTLTDEYAESVIDEVNMLFEDPENVANDGSERFLIGDAYWEHIAPREDLINTLPVLWEMMQERENMQDIIRYPSLLLPAQKDLTKQEETS